MSALSDFLHNLALGSSVPIFTALLVGMMAALGPCTMATNVATLAYISRRISERQFAIMASLLYALGRIVSLSLLGIIIIAIGMETPVIQNFLQDVGTYIMGPVLIIAGILMLVADRISFGQGGRMAAMASKVANQGLWGAFLMGVFFGIAFCPYSAVLYFMVLIPLALTVKAGIILPPFFALGTGLPVIIFGALISLGATAVSRWVNNISKAEKYLRIIMALIFIGVGVYYITQAI
jgi:cytochrome c biogenesis protein CcdA